MLLFRVSGADSETSSQSLWWKQNEPRSTPFNPVATWSTGSGQPRRWSPSSDGSDGVVPCRGVNGLFWHDGVGAL